VYKHYEKKLHLDIQIFKSLKTHSFDVYVFFLHFIENFHERKFRNSS